MTTKQNAAQGVEARHGAQNACLKHLYSTPKIDVRRAAQGKWPRILTALGIAPEALRNKHQPCPHCGGKDRFRFDDIDGRGTFYCNGCGCGDGFDLLKRVHRWDFPTAAREVEHVLYDLPNIPARRETQPSKTRDYALSLWKAAERAVFDSADDDVAAHPYALRKGIDWAAGALRGTASGRVIGSRADCLLIPIRSIATDELQAVQAINREGQKQTFGGIKGGCLLIGNTLETQRFTWFVAEGWATAASVVFHHRRGDAMCAVAFGKSNLQAVAEHLAEKYQPREIVILAEADA